MLVGFFGSVERKGGCEGEGEAATTGDGRMSGSGWEDGELGVSGSGEASDCLLCSVELQWTAVARSVDAGGRAGAEPGLGGVLLVPRRRGGRWTLGPRLSRALVGQVQIGLERSKTRPPPRGGAYTCAPFHKSSVGAAGLPRTLTRPAPHVTRPHHPPRKQPCSLMQARVEPNKIHSPA